MRDQELYKELFDKICSLFESYMKEKRASTQPQKLADRMSADPKYNYDSKDDNVREGLVEHVGFLPILATTIYPYVKSDDIDLGQALIMLAIHDIGETVTGDIITFLKKDSEAEKEQAIAVGLLDPYYHDLYRLVEYPSTSTSCFAKSMDKTVGDFMDYLCPREVTLQRYKDFLDLNSTKEIIDMKKVHKAKYFTWNPFLAGFFAYTLTRTEDKLAG